MKLNQMLMGGEGKTEKKTNLEKKWEEGYGKKGKEEEGKKESSEEGRKEKRGIGN